MTQTDRIEKTVLLRAPQGRVWRALADEKDFGAWFGCQVEQPFAEGATVKARITNPGYEHLTMEMTVVRIDPERYFAYRWHPYAVDPKVDYTAEPTTLVEFRLEPAEGGTRLTIVESGFDQIPPARRAEAYRMNDGGWTLQAKNIDRHVSQP